MLEEPEHAPETPAALRTLEESLQYRFVDAKLLARAVTHSSFANEQQQGTPHNERLEFLGDSALQLAITAILLEQFPEASEGELSKRRASLVNERRLAGIADRLSLWNCLRLGKGAGHDAAQTTRRAILADALEAVLGAIYLDSGFSGVDRVVRELFGDPMSTVDAEFEAFRDHKTMLQEFCMRHFGRLPTYEVTGENGPPHDRRFSVVVSIAGKILAEGIGRRKKEASQIAAQIALDLLESDDTQRIVSELSG